MPDRRVGVRVQVTGTSEEFRDLARDAALAATAVKAIPNRVSVRADSSGLATLERRAQQAYRSSSLLVDSVAMLAPTIAPLSAAAIAGIGGIANQAAIAGGALATTMLALVGVGDAVKALEEARLEPTTANLEKMRQAMDALPPAAQDFALHLQSLRPVLDQLRGSAAGGFLPGLSDGINDSLSRLPQVNDIIRDLSDAQGALSRAAGADLAGGEWDAFFAMLERTAKPTLMDLGSALGDLIRTGRNLWVAFEPLNTGFSEGMRDMAESLEEWSSTEDFTGFIDYVREATPDVLSALGSLSTAFAKIVQAGAPLGGPTLQIITALADALSAVADSPAGPALLGAAAGLAAINRAMVIHTKMRDSLVGGLVFGRGTASAESQVTALGRVEAGVRRLPTAFRELRAAQAAQATQAQRSAAAQTALIPTPERRAAVRDYQAAVQRTAAAERERSAALRAGAASAAKAAAGGAAMALAFSGASESMGLTNTTMLGLAGSMAGPWGAAAGAATGAILDLRASNDDLEESIRRVNEATTSSNLDQVAADAQRIKAEFEDTKDLTGFGDVLSTIGKDMAATFSGDWNRRNTLAEASETARKKVEELTAAQEDAVKAGQAAVTSDGLRRMYELRTKAINDSIDAMRSARSEALRAANAELDYQQSIDDARKSLEENGETLDKTTDAGRNNRRALLQMAAAWNSQSDATKSADGAHKRAIATFVRVAQQMGMNEDAARRYARQLFEIPPNRRTQIELETSAAMQKATAIKAELDSIDRSIDVYVNVRRPNAGGYGPQVGGFAYGGYTGHGGKYEPAGVVHRGEYVFSAEATQGHLAELEYLHRKWRGYASGGYVSPNVSVSSPSVSTSVSMAGTQIVATFPGFGEVVGRVVETRINARENRWRDLDG